MLISRDKLCPMMDRVCEVCQEYLASHMITLYVGNREQNHYLCDDHYQEMENPRRFISLLDYPIPEEDTLLKEIYPD